MLPTLIHIPQNLLKDYIFHIAYREFDCVGEGFYKPMHAIHEINMLFMINSKMHDFVNAASTQKMITLTKRSTPDCTFAGILTSFRGLIHFKGYVQLLTLHFKPTGFYRIFGLPPSEVTDYLGDSDGVFPKEVVHLHEQLNEAKTPSEMFQLSEKFLLANLNKNKMKGPGLEKATDFMLRQPGIYSIEELAYHSNMCLKTFERKFIQQVGLSPKLFERIRRFNLALDLKTYQPNLSWLDISYKTSYFDPMHMVKDFKKFASMSPTNLFMNAPPLYEDISVYQDEKFETSKSNVNGCSGN